MSRIHPDKCEYCGEELSTYDIDNSVYCDSCGGCVGVICPLCGGEGYMEENEMEADWINYDDEIVTCRECRGYGWTADPSFQ